jgi:hypothetical protein
MNCTEWQERVALFVGADLPVDEEAAVEQHLAACGDCRLLEQELSQSRAVLLSLRTINDDDLSVVRSNVLGALQKRKHRMVPAWLPYAAVIAALVIGWTIWPPRAPVSDSRGPQKSSGTARISRPSEPARSARAPQKSVRAARVNKRRAPAPAPKPEPTVVTLYTDDPDVVIVWITD